MFFDRSIDALQLAAQKKGYAYDRAILPWDQSAHPEPSDFKLRTQEAQEQEDREAYPGLSIFRGAQDWQHRTLSLKTANHNAQHPNKSYRAKTRQMGRFSCSWWGRRLPEGFVAPNCVRLFSL